MPLHLTSGEVPPVITPGDFRNTYAVYGMSGIDESTPPTEFTMGTMTQTNLLTTSTVLAVRGI
jgi:hypothetical protein